jgi:peptidoglycan-associated lipoprotein
MKNAVAIIAIALLAAACASNEKKDAPVVTDRSAGSTAPKTPDTGGTRTNPTPPSPGLGGDELRDPKSILSKRSVFFDYDSNSVKDEYKNLVQAHAKYMGDKRDSKIRIEGNCDERGSREYNLALGQRRAESVKRMMTVLGVQDGRIETVSFGEEKPVAQGHDEQSWAQNRRADIRYGGE